MAMIKAKQNLATALNESQPPELGCVDLIIDLSTAINSINGVPEWVQLLTNDEQVRGRDGREWINDDPNAIANFFNSNLASGLKLVVDWEHATEHKAPKGDPAPAAAWGVEVEIRNEREIWVRLDWTDTGRWAVQSREYRYLSPVLLYIRETLQIRGIKSVGLTNNPNLTIAALNQATNPSIEEHTMTLLQAICQALGLPEGSSEAAVIAKASTLNSEITSALNAAQNPDLKKFVPKADYDQVLATANNTKAALDEIQKTALEDEINSAIEGALKNKKIAPSTVDYHTANCQQEGGLARFKDYVEKAPAVLGEGSGLDGKDPGDESTTALNAAQQEMAGAFGNSEEDLKTHGG